MVKLSDLLGLSLTHGGIDIQDNYNESPTTQAYTQVAAQNNPDYAQMLSDIHRHGDIDRQSFNIKMQAIKGGLDNIYKEKLQKDRDNFEIYKLRETNKLAKDREKAARDDGMARLKWQRENALADRKEAREYQKQLTEEAYKRSLPKFTVGNNPSKIYGRSYDNIVEDLANGKAIDSREFKQNKVDDSLMNYIDQELMNSFIDKNPNLFGIKKNVDSNDPNNIVINQKSFSDYSLEDQINMLKNHAVDTFGSYDDQQKLSAYLNNIDDAYYNTMYNRKPDFYDPTAKIKPYTSLKDIDIDKVKALLGPFEQKFVDRLMGQEGFDISRDMPRYINYLYQTNSFYVDPNLSKANPYVSALMRTMYSLSPQELQGLGFKNLNGLQDKSIYIDPTTGCFIVSDIGSDNLRMFLPVFDESTRRILFRDMGSVNYDSANPTINNFTNKRFSQILGSSIENRLIGTAHALANPKETANKLLNMPLVQIKNGNPWSIQSGIDGLFDYFTNKKE